MAGAAERIRGGVRRRSEADQEVSVATFGLATLENYPDHGREGSTRVPRMVLAICVAQSLRKAPDVR